MFGNESTTATAKPLLDYDARLAQLRKGLHARLIQSIDLEACRSLDPEALRRELRNGAEELCRSQTDLVGFQDRTRLVNELVDETLGLGPLESLLRDDTVSDILINGPRQVFVERAGKLAPVEVFFDNEEHLVAVVQRIASRVGRRVDESSPMIDARLEDGSRVNAVIRPLALDGALVSIRRFAARPLTAQQLVASGAATEEMLKFLAAAVRARLNLVISGGTGSGKTTLLNLLSSFIPPEDRIVTIEDAAELRLVQPHVARMETRPANLEGAGAVSMRDLVRNALRMRPDRIIIGECRGGEAFDMLQAMNTGHDGSLTTIHANSPRDAIHRLELLVGLAGFELPLPVIHRQIASAVQLVVQTARLNGGVRKIVGIAEVIGADQQGLTIQDLFQFQQSGVDSEGRADGRFVAAKTTPKCLERMRAHGAVAPPAAKI